MFTQWDYLSVGELLEEWMGGLCPTADWSDPRPAEHSLPRDLVPFLGAGFSKSVLPPYPLFLELLPMVKHALRQLGDPLMGGGGGGADKESLTDLMERIQVFGSRRRMVEAVLSWPTDPEGTPSPQPICELARDPAWRRRWHPWKTLAEYTSWIDEVSPYDLDIIHPVSPPVIVARLLRERVFSRVVTTNWDALVEVGALLTGMYVLDPTENKPPRVPLGERDMLRVIESADDYVRAILGPNLPQLHKVNGGVSSILRLLSSPVIASGDVEKELFRRFQVTSSDLHEWERNRWARDLLNNALRCSSVLLVGVSADDAVTYHLLETLRQEWMQSRGPAEDAISRAESLDRGESPPGRSAEGRPRVFALAYSKRSVRLENVLGHPSRVGAIAIARSCDAWTTWQMIYARALIQRLLMTVGPRPAPDNWQSPLLESMMSTIVRVFEGQVGEAQSDARQDPLYPWLEVLSAAVPRWMTISRMAERIPALVAEGHVSLCQPTFYLPFLDTAYYASLQERLRTRSLLLLGTLIAAMWEAHESVRVSVDSWTGITTVIPTVDAHRIPRRFRALLQYVEKRLNKYELSPPPRGVPNPVSFLPLFPSKPLTPAEVKAALRLLGDQRCRLRGARAGGRVGIFVCSPDPSDQSQHQLSVAKYLGRHVPLVHIPFDELRTLTLRT